MMDGGKRKTDTLGCVFTDGNIAGHELTDHMAQSFPKPCERVLCLGADIHVNYSVHVISRSHQFTGKAETTSVMHTVRFSHQRLPCFAPLIIFGAGFLELSRCLAKGCSATLFLAQEVLRLGHQFPEHFIWYLCSICSSCVQREKLLSLTLGFPIALLLTVCCLHTLVFLCVGEEQFRLWVCVRKGTGNYERVKKLFFTYDLKNGLFKFSRQCLNTAQDGLELYMAKNNLEFPIFLTCPHLSLAGITDVCHHEQWNALEEHGRQALYQQGYVATASPTNLSFILSFPRLFIKLVFQ